MHAYAMTIDRESLFGCQFMEILTDFIKEGHSLKARALDSQELYLLRNIAHDDYMTINSFERALYNARRSTHNFYPQFDLIIRAGREMRALLIDVDQQLITLRWSDRWLTFDEIVLGQSDNTAIRQLECFDRCGTTVDDSVTA